MEALRTKFNQLFGVEGKKNYRSFNLRTSETPRFLTNHLVNLESFKFKTLTVT